MAARSRWLIVAVTMVLGIGACSTSSGNASGTGTTAATTVPSGSSATAPTQVAPTSVAPTPVSTSTAATAQNLVVTDDVRTQLLQAGAAEHNLPVTDYTGLAPGLTYYALDPATATYWAGAKLIPSSSSVQAQVSAQGNGAYDIFMRPANGPWKAEEDGLGGIGGTPCVGIPASVLAAWRWAPGTCRPPA